MYLDLQSLKVGDKLVRNKLVLSKHHGIYAGFQDGQYWVAENNSPHGVRYVSFEQFLSGQKLERVEPFKGSEFQRSQIIPFINSKVGTNYDLLKYNCEHFANHVQTGRSSSPQVGIGLGLGLLAFAFLGARA
jgi:Lecithin retinol acyltransferase